MANRMFAISFLTAAFTYACNTLAFEYFLYWRLWWFDVLPHFAGGVSAASFSCWLILSITSASEWPSPRTAIVAVMAFTLFVGVCWEAYEYSIGFTFNTIGSYPLDTLKDLLVDLSGGAVAVWYCFGRRCAPQLV